MSDKNLNILEAATFSSEKLLKLLKKPKLLYFLYRYILNPLVIIQNPKWAENIRTSVLKLGGGYINSKGLEAISYAVEEVTETNQRLLDKYNKGESVAWTDWMIPPDIVKAFGYDVWCPTSPFALSATKGPSGGAEYVAYAEKVGITEDLCSVNKSSLGCFFLDEMPKPAVCINGSHPCDSARMMNMVMDYYKKDVPVFTMNTPYGRSEEELEKWVRSTWDLIDFMEEVSGRKMDWDKLEEYARNIERFNVAMNELAELQRSVPAPPFPSVMSLFWRWRLSEAGAEKLAIAAEKLRDVSREYVEYHTKKGTPREKIRILVADQTVVWTDHNTWLYKKFGARVVIDYISRSCYPPIDFSSKESLVRSLANEKLYLSMIRQSHGTMELNIEETASMIEEYQVDCVIFNNHVGCKHNQALKKVLADVCRQSGVPSLFLDLDIVDNSYMAEDEFHEKIENFFKSHGLI